ncbi:MAG TPA: hypothetical protein VMW14_03145 [Candidatus Paceibacterota bacterium]|nr:hypothetical protein [Candidatus Paceibacterota bacterium]
MLGHYEQFPETVHGISHFTHRAPLKPVQQAIATAFGQLNQKKCGLTEISHLNGPTDCEVDFEIGIGEKATFTFLDNSEVERLKGEIAKKPLHFLDFLCVLQYHAIGESGRRLSLRFDYFLLRFVFAKNLAEFLVSHERGPRRVHVEDLICFVTAYVKRELAKHYSVSLKLE